MIVIAESLQCSDNQIMRFAILPVNNINQNLQNGSSSLQVGRIECRSDLGDDVLMNQGFPGGPLRVPALESLKMPVKYCNTNRSIQNELNGFGDLIFNI